MDKKEDIYLKLKKHGQEIIISEFFLFFGWLNLLFLSFEKWAEVIKKSDLILIKIVEIFEYKKIRIDIAIKLKYISK